MDIAPARDTPVQKRCNHYAPVVLGATARIGALPNPALWQSLTRSPPATDNLNHLSRTGSHDLRRDARDGGRRPLRSGAVLPVASLGERGQRNDEVVGV